MQTRLQSLIESCTDIGIGFVMSMVCGLIVYPLHGAQFDLCTNLAITAEFTALGLIRRYGTRRFFNWWHSTGKRMSDFLGLALKVRK